MSEADKKFEGLGFEIGKTKNTIHYNKKDKSIWFNLSTKQVHIVYKYTDLTAEEIDAICMKRKELWGEDNGN
jgi:hypothetical protein